MKTRFSLWLLAILFTTSSILIGGTVQSADQTPTPTPIPITLIPNGTVSANVSSTHLTNYFSIVLPTAGDWVLSLDLPQGSGFDFRALSPDGRGTAGGGGGSGGSDDGLGRQVPHVIHLALLNGQPLHTKVNVDITSIQTKFQDKVTVGLYKVTPELLFVGQTVNTQLTARAPFAEYVLVPNQSPFEVQITNQRNQKRGISVIIPQINNPYSFCWNQDSSNGFPLTVGYFDDGDCHIIFAAEPGQYQVGMTQLSPPSLESALKMIVVSSDDPFAVLKFRQITHETVQIFTQTPHGSIPAEVAGVSASDAHFMFLWNNDIGSMELQSLQTATSYVVISQPVRAKTLVTTTIWLKHLPLEF